MSALLNFQSLVILALLVICCCSYIRSFRPSWVEGHKEGFLGVVRRCAVIGDRLSGYVSFLCILMAFGNILVRD